MWSLMNKAFQDKGFLRRFWDMPLPLKCRLAEAVVSVSIATFVVKLIPYRYWGRFVGELGGSVPPHVDEHKVRMAKDIGKAVKAATGRLPFEAVCLPQALAASWMMRWRKIPGVLYLGIRKSDDGKEGSSDSMDLHAWLESGSQDITGGELAERYRVLAQYRV